MRTTTNRATRCDMTIGTFFLYGGIIDGTLTEIWMRKAGTVHLDQNVGAQRDRFPFT